MKTMGTESLMSFPSKHVIIVAGGIKHVLHDSTGEDSWKLVPGIPWILPHVASPLADFALDPFAIVNPRYGYN